MNRSAKILALAIVLAGPAWAFQQPTSRRNSFNDVLYGYSLDTPRFPGSDGKKSGLAFTFAGPPSNGFASNINVINQQITTNLTDYTAQSMAQVKQMKLKVNSQRTLKVSGRDALEIDYEGEVNVGNGNRKLRFLALSVIDKDRVLVLTCTAQPEDFAASEPEFRACLASFALKPVDL